MPERRVGTAGRACPHPKPISARGQPGGVLVPHRLAQHPLRQHRPAWHQELLQPPPQVVRRSMRSPPRRSQAPPVLAVPIPVPRGGVATPRLGSRVLGLHRHKIAHPEPPQPLRRPPHSQPVEHFALHQVGNLPPRQPTRHLDRQQNAHARVRILRARGKLQGGPAGVTDKLGERRLPPPQGQVLFHLVGQPRHVRQQVSHGHLVASRPGELGQIPRDPVLHPQLPLVNQPQQGQAADRLRNRAQEEHGISGHPGAEGLGLAKLRSGDVPHGGPHLARRDRLLQHGAGRLPAVSRRQCRNSLSAAQQPRQTRQQPLSSPHSRTCAGMNSNSLASARPRSPPTPRLQRLHLVRRPLDRPLFDRPFLDRLFLDHLGAADAACTPLPAEPFAPLSCPHTEQSLLESVPRGAKISTVRALVSHRQSVSVGLARRQPGGVDQRFDRGHSRVV